LCNPDLKDHAAVEALLFDGFIPAAYRDDAAGRWNAQDAERSLVFLARHLEWTIGGPNLAWWQLPLAVPGFARTTGIIRGIAFGIVFGLISGVVFGVMAGIAAGIVTGAIVATSAARMKLQTPVRGILRQPPTRRTVIVTVVAAILVVVVTAIVAIGAAIGGQAGQALTVLAIVGGVTLVLAGIVLGTAAQRAAPLDLRSTTSPLAVLPGDRRTVTALAARYGILYGAVLGIAVWGSAGAWTGLTLGIAVGVVVGAITSFEDGAWPSYEIARMWLVMRHKVPWPLMDFLADAYTRGVLRQAGAAYQFRHIELQHRLANRDRRNQEASSSTGPLAAEE
jgi:hypothetical protein